MQEVTWEIKDLSKVESSHGVYSYAPTSVLYTSALLGTTTARSER